MNDLSRDAVNAVNLLAGKVPGAIADDAQMRFAARLLHAIRHYPEGATP